MRQSPQYPNQRVGIFVDVQNLYYTARNVFHSRINYKNLLEKALAGRILTRAIAYAVNADASDREGDFFEALNSAGFDVKEKELQTENYVSIYEAEFFLFSALLYFC